MKTEHEDAPKVANAFEAMIEQLGDTPTPEDIASLKSGASALLTSYRKLVAEADKRVGVVTSAKDALEKYKESCSKARIPGSGFITPEARSLAKSDSEEDDNESD
jgi:hypothetical protein